MFSTQLHHRRSLSQRMAIALCIASYWVASVASAQTDMRASSDPEQRLQAVRHALAEAALNAPSRVRATSWIDETGTLRENTRISTDLRVRGVQVLTYLEEAGLNKQQRAAPGTATAAGDGCVPRGAPLLRHALLTVQASPADGRYGAYPIPEITQRTERALREIIAAGNAWTVSDNERARSAYERALYGPNEAARVAPWMLRLRVHAIYGTTENIFGQVSTMQGSPRRVVLNLQVAERETGRLVWERSAAFDDPTPSASLTTLPVPAELLNAMRSTLEQWHTQFTQTVACEPMMFKANADASGRVTLAAGARVGLRVGDQFLLFDRRQIPEGALEPGAINRIALVELQATGPDVSIAKVIAGKIPANFGQLVAMLP